MGGCGSGRQSEHQAAEDCCGLSISWMLQQGWLDASGIQSTRWVNCLGHTLATLTVQVRKSESSLSFYLWETKQTIQATSSPLRFGGVRFWLICPDCSRRCIALYRAPGQKLYSCRVCLDLTYRSCQESHGFGAIATMTGFNKDRVKNAFAEYRRLNQPPKEWTRKRDRRPGYRSRARRFYDYIQSRRACKGV